MATNSSYGATAREIHELFADYLDGDGSRPVMAIGSRIASAGERNAIDKSLEAFGYGANSCTFATLSPIDAQAEGGDIALDAHALFLLVEGLDPLHVIALDAAAVSALGNAYRTSFRTDAPIRVFGRQSAAFENLDALLGSQAGKQRAWKVLKSLQ